jgi:RNA-dependent RNA polymerase
MTGGGGRPVRRASQRMERTAELHDPKVYYRTVADDVHQPVPFDLLDDNNDDPWIRTTDITPSGAIGRFWVYRVSFKTWLWLEMKDALDYMKG